MVDARAYFLIGFTVDIGERLMFKVPQGKDAEYAQRLFAGLMAQRYILRRLERLRPGERMVYHVGYLDNPWPQKFLESEIDRKVKLLLQERPRRVVSVQRRIRRQAPVMALDGTRLVGEGFVYMLQGIGPTLELTPTLPEYEPHMA